MARAGLGCRFARWGPEERMADEEPRVDRVQEAAQPRRRRRRRRPENAFVSGTSSEFLGKRPLPRAAALRAVVFLLGPPGSGKTAVARRLLGEGEVLHLGGEALQEVLAAQVRRRDWREDVRSAPGLILDGPGYLHRRPAVVRILRELLRLRAAAGLRTMICEGADRSPLNELMEAVEAEQRATIALRFPVGHGRRRYALRICDELGLDRREALLSDGVEPWSYQAVEERLRARLEELRRERQERRRLALDLCERLGLPRSRAARVQELRPFDEELAIRILQEPRAEAARRRRGRRRRPAAERKAPT